MRLLRVIPSLDPKRGGPVAAAREIDSRLQARGWEIEVACLDCSNTMSHSSYPGVVHALGPGILNYGYAPRLRHWLSNNGRRFDAAIVNGIWQYHSIAARNAFAPIGIPYFVFTHGMLDPWFKRAYPLKHAKKWLYWPWADYRVLRDAAAVLFTSEEERHLARQSFALYRCNETVITYGTKAPQSDRRAEVEGTFRRAYQELDGKKVVLFLSRIHEKKGCDLLLEGFAAIAGKDSQLHLVVAGPDECGLVPGLQEQAARLGIQERVSWLGMLEGDMKWGAYYAAEAFCLPSHQENFGVVVAEALACGLPVLISNKVNIWREVEADGAGLVFDDTRAGVVSALHNWYGLSAERKAAMSSAASDCYHARFNIDGVVDDLMEIIGSRVSALTRVNIGGVKNDERTARF